MLPSGLSSLLPFTVDRLLPLWCVLRRFEDVLQVPTDRLWRGMLRFWANLLQRPLLRYWLHVLGIWSMCE